MNIKTKRAIETEQITITIDSELLYKYKQICKHYGHDLNEQIIFTMINYVHSFEINNGPISLIDYRVEKLKADNNS